MSLLCADFYSSKNKGKYGSASSSSSSSSKADLKKVHQSLHRRADGRQRGQSRRMRVDPSHSCARARLLFVAAALASPSQLSALFDKYTSPEEPDTIDGPPLASFFADLGMDVSGPGPLALAWQYKCANFATVERKEFIDYYSARGVDTLAAMKTDATRVQSLLKDKSQFKLFYRWLFDFVKEEEERKTIDCAMAFNLWSCVLPVHFALTDEWIAFCKASKSLKMVRRTAKTRQARRSATTRAQTRARQAR